MRERDTDKEAVPCGPCHVRGLNKESGVAQGRKHFVWVGREDITLQRTSQQNLKKDSNIQAVGGVSFMPGGCGMCVYHRLVTREEVEQLERRAGPGNGTSEMPS